MKRFFTPIFLCLTLCGLAFAQPDIGLDKVKEIKLLESNRDDVRRILASYKVIRESEEGYYADWVSTNYAEIQVVYSEGNCGEIVQDGFKVPEWKAIYILIAPNDPIKPKDLKIDLSKYKKEKQYYDADDFFVYHDKEAGIIFTVQEGKLVRVELVPSSKYYPLMCDQEKAKILSTTSSIFEVELNQRSSIISCPKPDVTEVKLSRTELVNSCDSSGSKSSQTCSEDTKTIDISTLVSNPAMDPLTYSYTVSGGKIIGTGDKVVWDLTGVKPGTHTITAAVDNGCGFCGKTQTKAIVVRECSGCR